MDQSLPKPIHYSFISKSLREGSMVPFLGAGASLSEKDALEYPLNESLPTGKELAHLLAERAQIPKEEVDITDLIEVASSFELYTGRQQLEMQIAEIFRQDHRPNAFHFLLAQIPTPLLIVTTNYDTLIEQAFRERQRKFHVIMSPILLESEPRVFLWWAPGASEPTILHDRDFELTPKDLPIIYKLHGGFDPVGSWQHCVITEEDYFEIGGRMYESSLLPLQVQSKIAHSSLLFLGYSLRDIHVQHLIMQGWRLSKNHHHFLVTKNLSKLDRERFTRQYMTIFELTIAEFCKMLETELRNQIGDNSSVAP